VPLDGNRRFLDGEFIFGGSKTVRGLLVSSVITTLAAVALGLAPVIGFVIGAAAMLGDLISSFIKRRLRLPPGSKATLLDQVPESLLPLLIYALYWDLAWLNLILICATFCVIEIFLSPLLYRWGLRTHPH